MLKICLIITIVGLFWVSMIKGVFVIIIILFVEPISGPEVSVPKQMWRFADNVWRFSHSLYHKRRPNSFVGIFSQRTEEICS